MRDTSTAGGGGRLGGRYAGRYVDCMCVVTDAWRRWIGRTAFVRRAAAAAAAIGWLAGFPIENAPTPGSGTRNRMRGLGGGGEGRRTSRNRRLQTSASQPVAGRAIGDWSSWRVIDSHPTNCVSASIHHPSTHVLCSNWHSTHETVRPSVRPPLGLAGSSRPFSLPFFREQSASPFLSCFSPAPGPYIPVWSASRRLLLEAAAARHVL